MTRDNYRDRLTGDQKKSGNVNRIFLAQERADKILLLITNHYKDLFDTKDPPQKVGQIDINIGTVVTFLESLHLTPEDLFNEDYIKKADLNKYHVLPESENLDKFTLGERIRYLMTEMQQERKDDRPTTPQSPFAPRQTYKLIGKIDLD